MEVIGHHYGIHTNDLWKPVFYGVIKMVYHLTGIIQNHFTIFNMTKQTDMVVCHDRYEITTFRSIIKAGKPHLLS